MSEKLIVKWQDFFGEEHVLMEGSGDDVYHAIPEKRNDDGDSWVEMIPKSVIMDFVAKLNKKKESKIPWIHTTCLRCGRPLKSDESKEIGYGPKCLKKMNAAIKDAQMVIDDFLMVSN